ncbi:MAG: hypothetical protein M3025_04630 [Actinomycetota bacterium]|nr:hypothetical protein [Actinomycetota bacterium]
MIEGFLCRDLTGDHRSEVVVLFSPAPGRDPAFLFIFRPSHGAWRMSYTTGKRSLPYIRGLSARGHSLVEKRPVFKSGLCCPSLYQYWALHWTGHGWSVYRTHR